MYTWLSQAGSGADRYIKKAPVKGGRFQGVKKGFLTPFVASQLKQTCNDTSFSCSALWPHGIAPRSEAEGMQPQVACPNPRVPQEGAGRREMIAKRVTSTAPRGAKPLLRNCNQGCPLHCIPQVCLYFKVLKRRKRPFQRADSPAPVISRCARLVSWRISGGKRHRNNSR